MPKQTLNYKLGYYVSGEFTDDITETNRWNSIDAQLRGIYEILGNGVIAGWGISVGTESFQISISTGNGIISFVTCESTEAVSLTILPNQTNYIYATLTSSSYWTKSVAFTSYASGGNRTDHILLGRVTTDDTSITDINTDDRVDVSIYGAIYRLIAEHKHIGGQDNPQPIDLASEVQGIIGQNNIPSLDTSIVSSGVLDIDRIPQIDHNVNLSNKGTLTHAQLDSFAQLLGTQDNKFIGETALINFLQLVLSLKHQWPDVDESLVNELSFIPGISPDSIIDTENTTANVDTRTAQEGGEHTISGYPGESSEIFTKTFDTEEELEKAEKVDVFVNGNSINLKTTEIRALIEDFEDVSDWKTSILDLSSNSGLFTKDASTTVVGDYSGNISLNIDTATNLAFVLEKTFVSQDWSKYDKMVFYIKTDNVEHGDIYFYLTDAIYGSQDSFTMVLEAGAPTINRDTLMVGWREIVVDISKFQRTAINTIGLYTSTAGGWDASKPLSLNIDNMYLTRGNEFVQDGYARFIYGDESYKNFYEIRWDASEPSGTVFRVRTRLANDLSQFDDSNPNRGVWSAYSSTNGFLISNPTGALYKYIQIEVFMSSSEDRAYSPELKRLYLDSYVSSVESQFIFDTKDEWESGTLVNADVTSQPGSVLIDKTSSLGFVVYGKSGEVYEANEDFEDVLSIAGSSLPKSTQQVVLGTPPSFGQISGVQKGLGNTFWLADTDNDRVVQIDETGKLLFGLYGSFLSEPLDPYGMEERGPGSNVEESNAVASTVIEPFDYNIKLRLLHSIYNPTTGILSLIFNRPLDVNYAGPKTIDFSKLFLKAGSYRFYFDTQTAFNLWGIDAAKYNSWYGSANPFVNQFNFSSHILQVHMAQADMATIASVINFSTPSLVITKPYQNEIIREDFVNLYMTLSNIEIGGTSGNSIRIKLDDGAYEFHITSTVTLDGLLEGKHYVEAVVVDSNNNPLQNLEAMANGEFMVDLSGTTTEPSIMITSPHPSQIFSSLPVQISFVVYNHPVLPVGSHIRYSVDGGTWVEHRSLLPISINNISSGQHTVAVFLADEDGNELLNDYSSTSITFSVGVTSLASLQVVMDSGAIFAQPVTVATTTETTTTATTTQTETLNTMTDTTVTEEESSSSSSEEQAAYIENEETICNTDVANIYMANIYAPVDVNFMSQEISTINPSGYASILVAKLRSPTSTTYLSATPTLQALNTTNPLPNDALFGSKFMDGHSVVQFDCVAGGVMFSNNAAKFSDNRTNSKKMLGSAIKISSNKVLIGDSIRNRAIITHTDLSKQTTFVAWEYLSNRNIVDIQPVYVGEKNISVTQTMTTPSSLIVGQGATVIWKNDSLVPVTIYAGTTTASQFALDPDLSLFEAMSQELMPGEGFSYTYNNLGTFNFFAYPSIVTGTIFVSASGISAQDQYLMVENDMSNSAFGSRICKVDSWGNILWSYGEGYIVDPKDVRLIPGESKIIIST